MQTKYKMSLFVQHQKCIQIKKFCNNINSQTPSKVLQRGMQMYAPILSIYFNNVAYCIFIACV